MKADKCCKFPKAKTLSFPRLFSRNNFGIILECTLKTSFLFLQFLQLNKLPFCFAKTEILIMFREE